MGAVLASAMQWMPFWLQLCNGFWFGFRYVTGTVWDSDKMDAVLASDNYVTGAQMVANLLT